MKKLFFVQIVVVATLVAGQSAFAQEKEPQFGKDPIKEIVKKMTLEEKVRVVVGKGFSVPGLSMGAVDNTPDKLAAISGHTIANPKFGIPNLGLAIVWPDIAASLSGVLSTAPMLKPGTEKPLPTTTLTFSSSVIFFTISLIGSLPNCGSFSCAKADCPATNVATTTICTKNNFFIPVLMNQLLNDSL